MMSRGVELPWTMFGRRIRPFSFVLMLATVIIAIEFHLTSSGPGDGMSEHFAGGFAFIAAGLLFVGWVAMSDAVHDFGLLMAAGVWAARSTLFFLDQSWSDVGAWLSICWALGAFGAYLLERYDHAWKYHRAHRE